MFLCTDQSWHAEYILCHANVLPYRSKHITLFDEDCKFFHQIDVWEIERVLHSRNLVPQFEGSPLNSCCLVSRVLIGHICVGLLFLFVGRVCEGVLGRLGEGEGGFYSVHRVVILFELTDAVYGSRHLHLHLSISRCFCSVFEIFLCNLFHQMRTYLPIVIKGIEKG